jgi:hypothetical protein
MKKEIDMKLKYPIRMKYTHGYDNSEDIVVKEIIDDGKYGVKVVTDQGHHLYIETWDVSASENM